MWLQWSKSLCGFSFFSISLFEPCMTKRHSGTGCVKLHRSQVHSWWTILNNGVYQWCTCGDETSWTTHTSPDWDPSHQRVCSITYEDNLPAVHYTRVLSMKPDLYNLLRWHAMNFPCGKTTMHGNATMAMLPWQPCRINIKHYNFV